jgi:hypothetical protein
MATLPADIDVMHIHLSVATANESVNARMNRVLEGRTIRALSA